MYIFRRPQTLHRVGSDEQCDATGPDATLSDMVQAARVRSEAIESYFRKNLSF